MDLIQFFGRFHVLVLHLPIGILMLASLLELFWLKHQRNPLGNWIWFWGAISAISACTLGYMLSQAGGYSPDAVKIHMFFGIITALIASSIWLLFTFFNKLNNIIIALLSTAQLAMLFTTGHYGANMTHGETYLVDHAPNIIRTTMGFPEHAVPRPPVQTLQQADIYLDLIAPMLQKRCSSCHNDAKQKGQLNLATFDGLMKGGKTGLAIVAGNPEQSELYQRISLAHDTKGFMPAEGKTPLTDQEVDALKWWITLGAPAQGSIASLAETQIDKDLLTDVLGLGNAGFSLPEIAPLDEAKLTALTAAGFVVKTISNQHNYLDVDYSYAKSPLTESALNALVAAKEHIVWLNLRDSQLIDTHMSILAQLPHLIKLRLEYNPISTSGMSQLAQHQHLQILNLYKTNVDDELLPLLSSFPALAQVFVGETKIANDTVSSFFSKQIQLHGTTNLIKKDVPNTKNSES